MRTELQEAREAERKLADAAEALRTELQEARAGQAGAERKLADATEALRTELQEARARGVEAERKVADASAAGKVCRGRQMAQTSLLQGGTGLPNFGITASCRSFLPVPSPSPRRSMDVATTHVAVI